MASSQLPLALVVIAGPQASGKSTTATALSDSLRELGERVALVELDQIAAMALPTLPSWDTAHAIFESVTAAWCRAELTCVIAEGSGSQAEVSRLLEGAPTTAVKVTVITTTPFEVAFQRARTDPSRGISKQHSFLEAVYERWRSEMLQMEPDVLLDTDELDVEQSIDMIRRAMTSARTAGAASR